MRRMICVLGLMLSAGCEQDDTFDVHVTVTNIGAVRANVHAFSIRDGDRQRQKNFTVHPGEVQTKIFRDVKHFRVKIFRDSDGFLIFDQYWDHLELMALDGKLEITVDP